MNALIGRVVDKNRTHSDLVEDGQHGGGAVREEVSEDSFGIEKVQI